jgi:rhodanese-related sulfurtransferase
MRALEEKLARLEPRPRPQRLPSALPEPGMFAVDATWGTIQPLEIAPGVRTVGELEVIAHLEAGLPLVDTRVASSNSEASIPGAIGIPSAELLDRLDELDRDVPTVYFCNGPQCAATPAAIRALLGAGHPAALIRYYRGGMHDWITLGLPVSGRRARAQDPTSDRPVIAGG